MVINDDDTDENDGDGDDDDNYKVFCSEHNRENVASFGLILAIDRHILLPFYWRYNTFTHPGFIVCYWSASLYPSITHCIKSWNLSMNVTIVVV